MSIKTRLILSYIAMTFIPVILFALIGSLVVYTFTGDRAGKPAYWEKTNQQGEWIAGLKFTAQTDPDRLMNHEFLGKTDKRLNELQAGIVVVKNHQITFTSPSIDEPDLASQLQKVQDNQKHHKWNGKTNGRFETERYNFTFDDGSAGEIYFLSDMSPFFNQIKKPFLMLLLSLLLVIALTNGILTYLVSRSLIKPLYFLKNAADLIKEGDLSHEVNLKRKDEIGELGSAFEEMRSRLSESIRLQLQYEENRKELISNISHDLKTPITGIKACVEGIQDGIADTGPKRDKYISMIAKKTEEMDLLIDELMLFSKLDLKRLPFHMESMDLTAYLQDCVEELSLDPRLEGVTVTYLNRGQSVLVTADRDKLRRVIMNIIDNSLKYMDKEKKEIRLEITDNQAEATVHIQDNGPGIGSAELPYIFDRFYRAEPSRNIATGGSGLGLAIVKQIVEEHGGNVWAESHVGEGTNIYFTLPKNKYGGEES